MEVTPNRPSIPTFIQSKFLWIRMANRSSRRSSDSDIQYRAYLWITRRRTGIVEYPTGIHSDFIINVINGRYFICQNPFVCCENITRAINIYWFLELTDANKLVVVVPLNPIVTHFQQLVIFNPIETVVYNCSQPQCVTQNFSSVGYDWLNLLCDSTSLTEPKNLDTRRGRATGEIETL